MKLVNYLWKFNFNFLQIWLIWKSACGWGWWRYTCSLRFASSCLQMTQRIPLCLLSLMHISFAVCTHPHVRTCSAAVGTKVKTIFQAINALEVENNRSLKTDFDSYEWWISKRENSRSTQKSRNWNFRNPQRMSWFQNVKLSD